jgi:hypothetical protein
MAVRIRFEAPRIISAQMTRRLSHPLQGMTPMSNHLTYFALLQYHRTARYYKCPVRNVIPALHVVCLFLRL